MSEKSGDWKMGVLVFVRMFDCRTLADRMGREEFDGAVETSEGGGLDM